MNRLQETDDTKRRPDEVMRDVITDYHSSEGETTGSQVRLRAGFVGVGELHYDDEEEEWLEKVY